MSGIYKRLLFVVLLIILALSNPSAIEAKRRLPQAAPIKSSAGGGVATSSRGVTARLRFRGDRLAIIVDFSNLGIASSLSYSLSYTTRGTTQGAGGEISPTENSTTREIIFGTCSHGVCRYDSGITNAKFSVTTTLKNGVKIVKPFRLKV